jgi:glycosyltransferase involved in cell wall biosynthesis
VEVAFDARYLRTTATDVLPQGGIGRYSLHLLRNLVALDEDLRLTLLVPAGNRRPILEGKAGGRVREVPVAAPAHGLRSLLGLARRVDLSPFDLYHGPFNVLPVGLPCPAVATVHDVMWLSDPALCMRHHLNRRASAAYFRFGIGHALRNARRILTVSDASRAEIERVAPRTRGRVRVTPNGVATGFGPLAPERALAATADLVPAGVPFVLTVGQGSPYKNQHRAVLAFLRAFRTRPDVRLVLVRRFHRRGDDAMRRLLATPAARARVVQVPSTSDEQLHGLYSRARIFLFPSLAEGFGLPLLEALACGVPAVTSNAPALAEVAGDAALQVDPRDVEALAEALARLDSDDPLRRRLARRGRQRAAAFTWRGCAERTLGAYREVLGQPAAVHAGAGGDALPLARVARI